MLQLWRWQICGTLAGWNAPARLTVKAKSIQLSLVQYHPSQDALNGSVEVMNDLDHEVSTID